MDFEKLTDKIINWIRDQVGNSNIVIGISGGKDSTICAMLSALAIGKEKVFGIMMPNGEQKDISDSKRVCKLLGINAHEVNIGKVTEALRTAVLVSTIGGENYDTVLGRKIRELLNIDETYGDMYETNTPARIRMATLYGIGAILGNCRIINTCNGDEDYVGYSTKYGDSAGDFSPLANLTVAEVLQVGIVCAKRLGIYEELKDLIFKTPDDGMSGKSDEQKLGFTYEVLGIYRRTGVCENTETKSKIDKMHVANLHKIRLMPKFEDPELKEVI